MADMATDAGRRAAEPRGSSAPQPAKGLTAGELEKFDKMNSDAVASIRRANPGLMKDIGGMKIPIIAWEDLSKITGTSRDAKPGSMILRIVTPENKEGELSIAVDADTYRHSAAAVVAALDFEFHKLVRAAGAAERYPQGIRSVLECNIEDLKRIGENWRNSGRTGDADALDKQRESRAKALADLKLEAARPKWPGKQLDI